MKLRYITFFAALVLLFGICAVSSCSKTDRFAGSWQSNPERLTGIPGVADASAVYTLDLAPLDGDNHNGGVNISAVIEAEIPESAIAGFDQTYATSIAATAMVTGHYTIEKDEDNDILLHFDPSSLKVNVDPSGVTFSQNLLSGAQQPLVDSLSAAAADRMRIALTPVMRDAFNRFIKIEDIKVHHSDIMSCELDDRDYTFRRVGVSD